LLDDDRRQKIERLYRRYGKGVGSFVLARVGDPHLAESITAGIFLLVVRRFAQCRGSPVAWLWSIVRTEVARYFRDRHEVAPLDVEPTDYSADPRRLAERSETDARMGNALQRLSDEQQTLVYMKFFLDMPNTDIAEALGMTPSNVGVVVHRAVKRLRELMTRDNGPVLLPQRPEAREPAEVLNRGTNHAAAAL